MPQSLRRGEQLLLSLRLLSKKADDHIVATRELRQIALLDDRQALTYLAICLGADIHSARRLASAEERSLGVGSGATGLDARAELGELGETFVVERCADELASLGRTDLASKVLQVSKISDSFGYDVSAPTISRESRLLEVKTQRSRGGSTFRLFISRNEVEVGRIESAWALVCCEVTDSEVSIVGWCRCQALMPYLPEDRNGRWTEALVVLPKSVLATHFPTAI
ncbi:protein NO VEIN domain-containing protein [Nonomuraea sp. LP-02]|uniref:protein NO VEIN domain-containing protein n=1 Tax=Nonomuraea sp. LP-02 TaxID=3097960 RepID=UPI003FA5C77D